METDAGAMSLVTLSAAAEFIDVPLKELRIAVERQELPVLGGCGELLVDPQEVERWLYPDEPVDPPFEAEYKALLRGDPCCYCGEPSQHIDHIVPRVRAGSDAWSNLTAACDRCNVAKWSRPLLTFLLGASPKIAECSDCALALSPTPPPKPRRSSKRVQRPAPVGCHATSKVGATAAREAAHAALRAAGFTFHEPRDGVAVDAVLALLAGELTPRRSIRIGRPPVER